MIRIVILGGLLAVTTIGATHADPGQYFCVVEQASGLHYDLPANKWRPKIFVANERYILRRLNDDDWKNHGSVLSAARPRPTWGVFEVGDHGWLPTALCAEDKIDADNYISCSPRLAEFGFDKDSLRFQVTHIGGYVTQGEDIHWRATDPKSYNETQRSIDPIAHPDDAFFEIGTCRPF